MTLIELKLSFLEQLENEYPTTEIDSFYNLLVSEYLGMNRLQASLNSKMELNEAQKTTFSNALDRLKNHEPAQYIIGSTEFYGLKFKVNPKVLIPRPETEELVSWALDDVETHTSASILDIGTGSGCIAVSLAKNLPKSRVVAMDFSAEALKTARENAKLNEVQVDFLEGNILQTEKLPQNFDRIVSNPPYVRELEKAHMQRNVLEHEPGAALYVKDENPLVFYRKIAELAKENLNKNGAVYLEINQYLATATAAVFQEQGFQTELRKDIFGNDRMLKGCFML